MTPNTKTCRLCAYYKPIWIGYGFCTKQNITKKAFEQYTCFEEDTFRTEPIEGTKNGT